VHTQERGVSSRERERCFVILMISGFVNSQILEREIKETDVAY
jgi:hypothetical protein